MSLAIGHRLYQKQIPIIDENNGRFWTFQIIASLSITLLIKFLPNLHYNIKYIIEWVLINYRFIIYFIM